MVVDPSVILVVAAGAVDAPPSCLSSAAEEVMMDTKGFFLLLCGDDDDPGDDSDRVAKEVLLLGTGQADRTLTTRRVKSVREQANDEKILSVFPC